MLVKSLKKFVKKIFNFFDLKLIKNKYKKKEINTNLPSEKLLELMRNCSGIMHFGAHRGDEAPIYNWFGKKVIWFEANPNIFESLVENLFPYNGQVAYRELLLDVKSKNIPFYLSNNDEASSSIFEFGELSVGEKKIWDRKLKMKDKIFIDSETLDDFVENKNINVNEYNHWVVDVQGSEFLFFKGASESLKLCKSIYVEISEGEVYKGGAQLKEIQDFLEKKNFKMFEKPLSKHSDILFFKE